MPWHCEMGYYEIIVESLVDNKRLRNFEGMSFKHLAEGRTVISGVLRDQAELFSIIRKIRDMNLELISIKRIEEKLEGML